MAYGADFSGGATVIVGDTPLDVEAALVTGARAVAVATGHFSVADLTAAGAHVTVDVEGNPTPLPAEADHSAYRILQESLTNVLRHAGPGAAAQVHLRYQPGALTITVTNDSPAAVDGAAAGDHRGFAFLLRTAHGLPPETTRSMPARSCRVRGSTKPAATRSAAVAAA